MPFGSDPEELGMKTREIGDVWMKRLWDAAVGF